MDKLKDMILERINLFDSLLESNEYLEGGIKKIITPFIDSLTNDGALSYLIGEKERYRASPLASSIIWLENAGVLPYKALEILQDKLIYLRDNHENEVHDSRQQNKLEGDEKGWSLSEGVSVWSTSLAIIALMDKQQCGQKRAQSFKDSVLWLVNQQDLTEKGWAYQKHDNCSVNIIMTSLALMAISLVANPQNIDVFDFHDGEKKMIKKSLDLGFEYVKNTVKNGKKYAYWTFMNSSQCVATTWALTAIKCLAEANNSEKVKQFYDSIKKKSLDYIINQMPKKIEKWGDEQIVCEGGAKYSKQKNYYSFTASLLIQLFDLGVSPYHPKVVMQIKWLLVNSDNWKIENYDKTHGCSFTCAMNVAVICKWLIMVGSNAESLLLENKTCCDKLYILLCEYKIDSHAPYIMISKRKLCFYMAIIVLLILATAFGKSIYLFIYDKVDSFLNIIIPNKKETREIYINIVASGVIVLLSYLLSTTVKLIRRGFKWLTNRF